MIAYRKLILILSAINTLLCPIAGIAPLILSVFGYCESKHGVYSAKRDKWTIALYAISCILIIILCIIIKASINGIGY